MLAAGGGSIGARPFSIGNVTVIMRQTGVNIWSNKAEHR